jgi:hypothetical protein
MQIPDMMQVQVQVQLPRKKECTENQRESEPLPGVHPARIEKGNKTRKKKKTKGEKRRGSE